MSIPIVGTIATGAGVVLAAAGSGLARLGVGTMKFATRSTWGFGTLLGRTNINYAAEVGDPSKNSIVVAVVGWIAKNFPEAPVRIRRLRPDGGWDVIQPALEGPGAMLRLLERPNAWYSGVLLWVATVIDVFTEGNGYWLKVRNDVGRVIELWWAPARLMKPVADPRGQVFIGWYEYTVDSVKYRIETKDVVHFREGMDPREPRRGLSKLASLFREIYTDDEAANFTAVLLTNLGVPGVVISPANGTSGSALKADPEGVKTKFMDKFGGDHRGEPLVLTAPTDVKVLSFSPDQMQLRELRRIPEERISAVLGVSAIVAGLGAGLDRSTFTNFGEARRAAYQESIVPLQRVMSAELELQLLNDFADLDAEMLDVDFDTAKASALQEALDAVWARASSAARGGLLTRSAFKTMIGQPVTPADDVYIYPNNFNIIAAGGDGTITRLPPAAVSRPNTPQIGPGSARAELDSALLADLDVARPLDPVSHNGHSVNTPPQEGVL